MIDLLISWLIRNKWFNEGRKEGRKEKRIEWIDEWKNEWMNEWMNDWMNEWMNEWMWVNGWMNEWINRPQNSPYFWVFKYARAVKQKVWKEAENGERDWGNTLKIRTVRFAYVIFVRITRFSQPRAEFPLTKSRCKLSASCQVMFSTSHSRYSVPWWIDS